MPGNSDEKVNDICNNSEFRYSTDRPDPDDLGTTLEFKLPDFDYDAKAVLDACALVLRGRVPKVVGR